MENQNDHKLIIEDTKSASYIPSRFYSKYLPVSIPFDQGIVFIALMVVMTWFPLSFLTPFYRYIFLPFILTFFIFKIKLNYQPVWYYLPKRFNYLFSKNITVISGLFEKERNDAFDRFSKPTTVHWSGEKIMKKKEAKKEKEGSRK